MKSIQRRVETLEGRIHTQEEFQQSSGDDAAARELLRRLFRVPKSVHIGREIAELMVTGKLESEVEKIQKLQERVESLAAAASLSAPVS
jgi:hypothetical protein